MWSELAETLTGVWRRVVGLMVTFLAELCRSVDGLHNDMAYVLIRGLKWQIQRRERAFNDGDSTLRTFDSSKAVGRGHRRLINRRSRGSREYQQRQDCKTLEKVKLMALIVC